MGEKPLKYISILFFCVLSHLASSQASQFDGLWSGTVANSVSLNLSIETKKDSSCNVYLTVPMQFIDSLISQSCTLAKDSLIATFNLSYNQTAEVSISDLENESIKAQWRQGQGTADFVCQRVLDLDPPLRPQEPIPPYPYTSKDIQLYNSKDAINLAGSLTLPDSNYLETVVILISGSGPQNRNSEILGHKPFLVLSDYLTRNGIAVLRYDDRGVGQSQGEQHLATSEDFKNDFLGCVNHLDNLGFKNIGCIGHSEGAMIAQMGASQSKKIKFLVSLAGPAIPINQLMLLQNKFALGNYGFDSIQIASYLKFQEKAYAIIDTQSLKDSLYSPLKKLCFEYYERQDSIIQKILSPSPDLFYIKMAGLYLEPWFRYFINYDPSNIIPKITCPILALNGSLDVQVTSRENIDAYENLISKMNSPRSKTLELEGLNHLFQTAKTGNTSEYYKLTETFNEDALRIIYKWISDLDLP